MPIDRDNEPHGFAGLAALVSEIPDELAVRVADTEEPAPLGKEQDGQPDERPVEPTTKAKSSLPAGGASTPDDWRAPKSGDRMVWVWVVGGIVAVIFLLAQLDDWGSERSASTSTSRPSTTTVPQQQRNQQQAPSASRLAEAPSAQQPTRTYVRPPVGTNNVLSIPEIRWCERESIRIDAIRPIVSSNAEVARFNSMVDAYNSRCRSFRYRQGSLESARRSVLAEAAPIRAEAIRDFRGQSGVGGAQSSDGRLDRSGGVDFA
jgi:hypothetical protein